MATILGGLNKKVVNELSGVVKKTAKDTIKAGVDIVKGTVENTVGGGVAAGGDGEQVRQPEQQAQGVYNNDPMEAVRRQAAIKKQQGLQRVRGELAKYVNKKNQEDNQEEMVEERQEEMKKDEEKQREESEREVQINQARRRGGGTGEMARKKH